LFLVLELRRDPRRFIGPVLDLPVEQKDEQEEEQKIDEGEQYQ
jgi:hypothetical protein